MKYLKMINEMFVDEHIIYCVDNNDIKCVKNYLENGYKKDLDKLLKTTIKNNFVSMFDLIMKYVDIKSINLFDAFENYYMFEELIKAGGDVNDINDHFDSLLIYSIIENNLTNFNLLIKQPDLNFYWENKFEKNAMDYAIVRNKHFLIGLLMNGMTMEDFIQAINKKKSPIIQRKIEYRLNGVLVFLEDKYPELYNQYIKLTKAKEFNI